MLSTDEPYLSIDITLEEKEQKFLGDHKFGHGSQLLLECNIPDFARIKPLDSILVNFHLQT